MTDAVMRLSQPGSAGASAAGELARALSKLRGWLTAVALFSGVVNILALTGSVFMLQVYDRVLVSRSVPTLVGLVVIVAFLYAVQGVLDVVRARMLVRMGARLDEMLGARVFALALALPVRKGRMPEGAQPVRDLDTIRSFLSGPGPSALLDLPWLPLYLAFVFLLSPWLGLLATFGALVLVVLAGATELLSREPARRLAVAGARRQALALAGARNAEVLAAMRFGPALTRQWLGANGEHRMSQQEASDVTGALAAASRAFRALLQSGILALGAWLTLKGDLSGGAIIAGSIAAARALAPIEQSIANWRPFLAARASRRRLAALLAAVPPGPVASPLPAPVNSLSVEGLWAGAPGAAKGALANVSFTLRAGQGLGIIGPSAAGKSTLARTIVGAWPALRGTVRLDGAALEQWPADALGRHIGYLPQDVELFDGTVAQNIARFEEGADPARIHAATRAAGVHEMIVRLPEGYDTPIGEDGTSLSAGQRQRIGLARALYGEPFLVVLDEPNANLDAEGEAALARAVAGVRARGGIAVIVAHRPATLAVLDTLAILANGTLAAFGPKDEMLARHLARLGRPTEAGEAEPPKIEPEPARGEHLLPEVVS